MFSFTDHRDVSTVKAHVEQIQKRPFAQLIGQDLIDPRGFVLV